MKNTRLFGSSVVIFCFEHFAHNSAKKKRTILTYCKMLFLKILLSMNFGFWLELPKGQIETSWNRKMNFSFKILISIFIYYLTYLFDVKCFIWSNFFSESGCLTKFIKKKIVNKFLMSILFWTAISAILCPYRLIPICLLSVSHTYAESYTRKTYSTPPFVWLFVWLSAPVQQDIWCKTIAWSVPWGAFFLHH